MNNLTLWDWVYFSGLIINLFIPPFLIYQVFALRDRVKRLEK